MENRNIWIINHYALIPSKDGSYGRHIGLARHLMDLGWLPTVFAASTRHPSGEQAWPPRKKGQLVTIENGVPCVWVRAARYGHSMVLRMLNILGFTLRLLLPSTTKGLAKPALIWGSTVHPLAAWSASVLARRLRVPFVYEIRDIWPESLIDLKAVKPHGMVAKVLYRLSDDLVRQSDLVISPLREISKYLQDRGFSNQPSLWISNAIDEDLNHDTFSDVDGAQRPFTFMYLGSFGFGNDIDTLFQAFDDACRALPDQALRLRLVGDGPRQQHLLALARSLDCREAITFEPKVPRADVFRKAAEADCLVANLAPMPVLQYGISPNKYFDYMLAERPAIVAAPTAKNPIDEAGSGITFLPGSRTELAKALVKMPQLSDAERRELGLRGKRHVLENYTYQALARRLADALDCQPLNHPKKEQP